MLVQRKSPKKGRSPGGGHSCRGRSVVSAVASVVNRGGASLRGNFCRAAAGPVAKRGLSNPQRRWLQQLRNPAERPASARNWDRRRRAGSQLQRRWQMQTTLRDRSARRQAKADFCLLFGGLQKVRRPAGRDPPVLPLTSITRVLYGEHRSSLPDLYTVIKPPLNGSAMIQPYKNSDSAANRPELIEWRTQ